MTAPACRVLGIDPGSRILGYAVLDVPRPGALVYRDCGIITAPASRDLPDRLVEIAADLRAVVREWTPQVAAVEDVFVEKNVRSAFVLGQARGAALLVLRELGLALQAYPPATVKRTVCGSGRAGKEQVQRMVTTLAGLSRLPSPDAADALALAITHALRLPRTDAVGPRRGAAPGRAGR